MALWRMEISVFNNIQWGKVDNNLIGVKWMRHGQDGGLGVLVGLEERRGLIVEGKRKQMVW